MAAKASCQVTIADITDAYSAVLTSETYTFMGNTSGAPIGSACTTQAMAYQGNIRCSKVTIGTISCPTGISASVSNNGTISPTITFKTTAVISTACEASVPVIIDGITIYKKFSFAVANQGAGFGWNIAKNTAELPIGTGTWESGTWRLSGTGTIKNVTLPNSPLNNLTQGILITRINTSDQIGFCQDKYAGLLKGEAYTVSAWVKCSEKMAVKLQTYWTGDDTSGISQSMTVEANKWTHLSFTSEPLSSSSRSIAYIYSQGGSVGATMYVCGVKLEKGTKATEWTPHPDDLVGDTGKGIKSTAITYQASTSGTTIPTGTWSGSIPTVSAGQYLWTRTIMTYTDNTTSTLYSVGKMGTNGTNGANGSNGKSIGSVTNYYLATASSSGVTASTSGWTTSVQSVSSNKKYLWNYEVVKYTDGTTASTTAPCIIGTYGDTGSKGDKGDKGDTGSDGTSAITVTTSYSYTQAEIDKYSANGYSGTWNVTSTSGIKVGDSVFLRVTNTTVKGYSYIIAKVTRVVSTTSLTCTSMGVFGKGNIGATGATGNGIKSITEHYAVSTSNSSAPTTWSTTVPTMTETNKYLWNYETITYTNNTTNDTAKRVIGVYGNKGATGPQGPQGVKGEADIKCYKLTGGSNQLVWSKLGTLTSAGDNSNFIIDIYTGSGYNGQASQNSQAEIVIKDGWQASASTTAAFGVSVTRQNCDDLKVQVRATASDQCDVWVYLPWSYSWGTYTVAGKYTSWATSQTTQTAEPTTGTLQDLAYRMNPENAAKVATNFLEFTSGTGLQVGNKTNGSWSGYRTKISASAFEILNQAGTTLAYYGDKLIQLGKNAKDAIIELCGGVGKILVETKSGNAALSIQSEYVDIKGVHESVLETSSSSGSCIAGAVDDSFVVNTYSDANNKANFDIGNGSIILESKKKGYQAEVEFYGCGWSGVYTGAFAPTKAYSEKIMLGDSGRVWERLIVKNSPQVTSDRRAKTNIFPLGESKINKTDIHSELFDRLKPVQYRMIDGDGRICYGFVAQDVVEAMRELGIREDELDLVHHDRKNTEDGYIDTYSMVYTNLIAVITHELQLEKERRSNLEIEVADLRSELESMRDNISGDTN